MPPDRTPSTSHATTQRFSDAISTGLPLSSVGPSHAPSLERGRACLTCRRRRVKCDGAKPVCGRCAKSAKAHGEDPNAFSCDYDSQLKTNKTAREADSIAALAAQVAALKQQLAGQQQYQRQFYQPQQQQQHQQDQSSGFNAAAGSSNPTRQQTSPPIAAASIQQLSPVQATTTSTPQQQQQQHYGNGPQHQQQQQHHYSNAAPASDWPAAPLASGNASALDVAVSYVQMTSGLMTRSGGGGGGGENGAMSDDYGRLPSAASAAAAAAMWSIAQEGAPSPSDHGGGGLTDSASAAAPANPWAAQLHHHSSSVAEASSSQHSGSGLADLAAAASPLYQLPSWSYGALTVSGYPSDLPSLPLMRRLIDVYFAKPHLASGLIDEARFRASFAYPSDDPRSPVTCLLHAIAATAAMWVNEETFFAEEPKYWLYDGQGRTCSDYHARRAQELFQSSLRQGRQLLQIVQASVLCVFCAYTNARYSDIWIQSAECSRMAVVIDLIHVRAVDPALYTEPTSTPVPTTSCGDEGTPAVAAKSNRPFIGSAPNGARTKQRRLKDKSILPATLDPDEIAERCAVFWFVFGQDRMTSAASGWAATIDEADLTTLLPHPVGAPDTSEDPLSSPLCIHNPSFFFANPPHLVKRLQLHFKAFVLLGRVSRFLQRAPSPIGSGYPQKPGEPDLRDSAAFRSLDNTISHFSHSIPRGLQYSFYAEESQLMEMTPLLAFTITHVCVILMHEPFCLAPTIEVTDSSFKRCLEAAKAIVASVYELSGSSFETGLLYSFLNWLWAVAGRTLVRALALTSRRGDLIAASQLAQDVQALITAMRANRSPIGLVTAQNLQRLLANPFHVLNEAFTGTGDYPHAEDENRFEPATTIATGGVANGSTPASNGMREMEELAEAVLKDAVGESWSFGVSGDDSGGVSFFS